MGYEQTRRVFQRLLNGRTRCHYCPAIAVTRDHIVPRALGGTHALYNSTPACYDCNQKKGESLPTCRCKRCRYALRRWQQRQRLTQSVAAATQSQEKGTQE